MSVNSFSSPKLSQLPVILATAQIVRLSFRKSCMVKLSPERIRLLLLKKWPPMNTKLIKIQVCRYIAIYLDLLSECDIWLAD